MIDEKSYKILKILQEKARIPNAEVARRVDLAPSAVLERIRKLESQGYIDGYEVRLNPSRFARSLVTFIHVSIDVKKLEEIEQRLLKIPEIQEIHLVTGRDALFLKVRSADNNALGSLLFDTILKIPGVLSSTSENVVKTIRETGRIPLPEQS